MVRRRYGTAAAPRQRVAASGRGGDGVGMVGIEAPGAIAARLAVVRRLGLLVVASALLAAGLVAFHRLGHGALEPPPLTDPASWAGWAAERQPLVAVAALGRLLVVALGWYLVAVIAAGTVARVVRAARLVRLVDAVSAAPVRRLLDRVVGAGVATGLLATSVAVPGLAHDERPPVVMVGDPDASDHDDRDPGGVPLPLGLLEASRAGRDEPADELTSRPSLHHDTAGGDVSHEVRAGESFWTIAADALAAAWQRPPTDREVVGYWHAVIDANRHRLADPDNADLIFPGQRFLLPPPPAPPP